MLVVFAANFLVFCHCAARAEACGRAHSCCEKKACAASRPMSPESSKHSDCQGMQAVRFNLVEKQVSASIGTGELPVVVLSLFPIMVAVSRTDDGFRRMDWWIYKYSPPDLQVLYQRFLI